ENVPPEFRPDYYDLKVAQFGGIKEWGDAVLSSKDEALEFASTFAEYNRERLAPVIDSLGKEINTLMRDYMRGQMEFQPDKKFYPDANLTLRIAYGKVAGCRPCDGVAYLPVSTIEGIMEKDNPEIFDYNIPQKLRDLYRDRDFGRWESDGSVPVCFLATNHTTGGNSGSPVINADGRLIGINFDRAWDGVMSDLFYNPEICRNISLDIRYALFIIDKLANATNILEELVLVP
ncbi:MAG: S46 family peptidase, partial [Bacteroidales bacterium]|nr:S46 family peptidase [Bacteroidales bacterium]